MPIQEKYQSLPDLDTWSPDVFETQDVQPETPEPDVASVPSVTDNDDIDYTNISAEAARQRFLSQTLRAGPIEDAVAESVDMKIARLQREIEELTASLGTESEAKASSATTAEVSALAEAVKNAMAKRKQSTDLIDVLGPSSISSFPGSTQAEVTPVTTPPATRTIKASSDTEKLKIIDLDARLANLERALGNPSSTTFRRTFNSTIFETPILPTLASLSQRVNSLTRWPEQLDENLARVRELVAESEKIPASKAAATKLVAAKEAESADEKLDLLFNSLASVERLANVVPSLLDRLKSLDYIHSEAEAVVDNISSIKTSLGMAESEMSRWLKAIEDSDKRLDELEERERENLATVKNWVADLEAKVSSL